MSRWHKGSASTRIVRWVLMLVAIFLFIATIPVIGPKSTPITQCNGRSTIVTSAEEDSEIRAEFSVFPLGLRCLYQREGDSEWVVVDPPWAYTFTFISGLSALAAGVTLPLVFRSREMRKKK
ncbi:hypothetical protein MT356_20755 [Rathayibacter festucae]|uniref:hypothetical protein n=1 Tax=Rathayibacter festucae TaxID=110937 RepID=UPI001FB35810|nr:hypothetical protein [Rathayibacter festucae]MCJ1702149.1 hypothetical protein [Rathayibacter festucae]